MLNTVHLSLGSRRQQGNSGLEPHTCACVKLIVTVIANDITLDKQIELAKLNVVCAATKPNDIS